MESGEEDGYYYTSDQESLDGLDHDQSNLQPLSSTVNSAKVITKESLLAAQPLSQISPEGVQRPSSKDVKSLWLGFEAGWRAPQPRFHYHQATKPKSPRKSTASIPPVASPVVKSRWSFSSSKKSFGSKDETFFDTQQQWLQSDSDDDFHSVNGDFTPSRGNTPKCSFSDRPPRIQSLIFHERKSSRGSSPAPRPRRKKLGELFRDSIREQPVESCGASSSLSSPYLSGVNSGELNNTAIEDISVKEEKKKKKSNWQHHRCLPGFSSCGGGLGERRKKLSSETGVVNGK